MNLEWNDSYRVGDALMDAQHQHFFTLGNAFMAAQDKAELTRCAMQLYRHTREHFGHEEQLMRKLNYPGLGKHVDWHNGMISRLNALSRTIQNDTLNKQDLVDLTEDWALNHIPVHDAMLHYYLMGEVPTMAGGLG
jgi:hemerythrin-like metal-binding protein